MTAYLSLAALPIFIVFRQRPHWALFVLFLINYLHLSNIVAYPSASPHIFANPSGALWVAIKILGPAMALMVLYRWFMAATPPSHVVPTLALLICYGLWLSSSALHARFPDATFRLLELYVRYFALSIVAAALIRNINDLRYILLGCICGALIIGLVGVYSYGGALFGDLFGELSRTTKAHISGNVRDYRFEGPVGANELGALLVFVIPIAVERLYNDRSVPIRLLTISALVLALYGFYLTASRGAVIALTVIFSIEVYLYRQKISLIVLSVITLLAIATMLPHDYIGRIMSISGVFVGSDDGSIEQRRKLITIGLALFGDHPLFGVGLGGYNWHVREYAQALGMEDPGLDMSAHNTYLEVAAEQGFVGLIFFLSLVGFAGIGMVRTAGHLRQQGRRADAELVMSFVVGSIGYLVALLFLTFTDRLFWMLLTVALVLPHVTATANRLVRTESRSRGSAGSLVRALVGVIGTNAVGKRQTVASETHGPRSGESRTASRSGRSGYPVVFIGGLRSSGGSEVRNALRASDETIEPTLKIASEAATGAELLARHRDNKLIWVYQHFHVSAVTRMHRFGVLNCQERFQRMLRQSANDSENNWPYAQMIYSQHQTDGGLSPYDVAVLSWHLKNSEILRLELHCGPRVLLLSQAAFSIDAKAEVARLQAFVGIRPHRFEAPDFGGEDTARHPPVEPAAGPLSREIREHCEELWDGLERARKVQIGEAGVRESERIRGGHPTP